MKAVVGLGNPGREYELSRHNVGFLAIDMAADRLGASFSKKQCRGLLAETRLKGERVVLLKPQTYMNLSGLAVLDFMQWFKLSPEDIFILSDDIDLPQGVLRIRLKGGAGTHNGWRSILEVTSSQDFPRGRIGVGAPPPLWDLKDWVLSRWDQDPQADAIQASIEQAGDAAVSFLEHGIQLTMNRFNTNSRAKKDGGETNIEPNDTQTV
ncbi:MAG: aminoacyl-tRNA hydrolase [Eubacteriales bacterium]|nr:aminoacyl-tRNA hydrolase [Eubacteriales bacterium]